MITKKEIAEQIRKSLTQEELLTMVLNREPVQLVTKPVSSHRYRHASQGAKVLKIIQEGAKSTRDICDKSSLTRPEVSRAIGKLKDDGEVFQGGERKFTRYGTTQVGADKAAADAQGK
jgi:CRP-like cAMP-binding protein